MSQLNNFDGNFILKSVKAVDQNKFESDILFEADKAYKHHVHEQKAFIQNNLTETCDKIKVLSKSVNELNECLIFNLKTNKCPIEEFNKIRNSLQNQLDLKQIELRKLSRLEKRYRDELASFEASERFHNILDDGRIGKLKRGGSFDRPASVGVRPETSDTGKKLPDHDDGADSDGSAASTKTMTFEPSEEQLELIEPVIKKRKIVFRPDKQHRMKSQRIKHDKTADDANNVDFSARVSEYHNEMLQSSMTSPTETPESDVDLGCGVAMPADLWARLYDYQQAGVRWLLQLHGQGVGGILGDEMGLGKTIQVIAFLEALRASHRDSADDSEWGPVLIVCPATVMRQWVDEFRIWAPLFRVALLHATGGGYDKPEQLLQRIASQPGVVVTTYSSMVLHHALLQRHRWPYVILDEGHKIKNPNAKVTLCAKQIVSPHRLILSGSPIQNNLKELWSLVDFVYPGKLGSLATFVQNFALPIMRGGYEQASPVQVEMAYRCACVIRDTINEYLLRRTKAEVELQLPRKSEQVLFCGLTEHQMVVYREYLSSRQCKLILSGQQVPFPGLVMLRKICNHPDLVTGGPKCVIDHPVLGFSREAADDGQGQKFGHHSRSGKMVVVRELLQLWHRGRHKVLLFTQGRLMLQILKRFLEQQRYTFCTMDGTTAVGARHAIVNRFNDSSFEELFVFLLTTRVGGLGLNLIGADRVVVFDPDWNPWTDLQARERVWRIGQNRKVVIYRLVIGGSVEEKIYHRQVFKQFLTNRILKNPRQRRFFKTQDLRDLFRLDEPGVASDTSLMLRGTKHYKKLPTSNYFDEARELPVDALNADDDDHDEVGGELEITHLDIPDEEQQVATEKAAECHTTTDDLVAASSLSDEQLTRLRRQARRLSRLLTAQQQQTPRGPSPIRTRVEGALITNVSASKKYCAQGDSSSTSVDGGSGSGGAGHIVAALIPRKAPGAANISYSDVCAAERVANKARKALMLEQTLAGAGVTDRVHHDALVDDPSPDWMLLQREADMTARSSVAWLRNYLQSVSVTRGPRPIFGTARSSYLWDRHEEIVYFQSLELPMKSHFGGTEMKKVRFSSPFLLTIIKNRRGHLAGAHDNAVVSGQVKGLTKSVYLFLTGGSLRGQATSNDLIGHFRDQVSSKNNLLFKSILKELCTFDRLKGSHGGGIWRLKAEFLNK